MDSAADSLLALSTTAAAFAGTHQTEDDDDRSSSLSELDGELDEAVDEAGDEADEDELDEDEEDEVEEDAQNETPSRAAAVDADSEAETERLEESPDKSNRKKSFIATPSKLAQPAQTNHSPNERPEIESLTDSAISSPISSHDDSDDDLSDAPAEDGEATTKEPQNNVSSSKRKREDDSQDENETARVRRRRTESVASEDAKTDRESEPEDGPSRESREGTTEPAAEADDADQSDEDAVDKDSTKTKTKKPTPPSRTSSRRKGKDEQPDNEAEGDEEAEGGEETDAEVDDADANAKSEEEQAKRMAAMEGLTVLERHFATLRDRLYDERIAAINHELAQLAESTPSHPELLKQLDAVKKHRDEKFDTEQKLLVFKIGALKNKSVAERAQIHSAYFQTIRDLREKHLERLGEHFYRIQRERFKSQQTTPSFGIPFATKRSKQITQQTAYNKEVSILSGVAKYVGFPAAPDLAPSDSKQLEDDLQKMGLAQQHRQARPIHRVTSTFSSLSAPAAEEQFLEKNPWANAQHPIHRLGLSRQNSNRSPLNEGTTYLTPAHQHRQAEKSAVMGSASTIAEFPSSSQMNTPYDTALKPESQQVTGYVPNGRHESVSPLDARRNITSTVEQQDGTRHDASHEGNSSPLASRVVNVASSPRPALALADNLTGRPTASPSMTTKPPAITTGPGFGSNRF